MLKKFKCTVTPRQNAKSENKVKRRCFLLMSDSKGGASALAVEKMTNDGIERGQYKLEVELFDGEQTDYITNTDGELLELPKDSQPTAKPQKASESPEKPKKPFSKSKPEYTRAFSLVSYIDTNVLENWISQQSWIQHWAMALHDKDKNEDGTPKEAHTHLLLYTYSAKTSSAIKKRIDKFSAVYYHKLGQEPQNTLSQECESMSMMWRYLTHMDDPDKYQYPDSIRRYDFYGYWKKLENDFDKTCANGNLALAIVNDILDGCSTMELIERYGREYVINRQRYNEACISHFKEIAHKGTAWDLVRLCLEASNFGKDEQYIFWNILDYIKSECMLAYGVRADFVLDNDPKEIVTKVLPPIIERI